MVTGLLGEHIFIVLCSCGIQITSGNHSSKQNHPTVGFIVFGSMAPEGLFHSISLF